MAALADPALSAGRKGWAITPYHASAGQSSMDDGGGSVHGMPPGNAGTEAVSDQSPAREQTDHEPSPAKRQRTSGSSWMTGPAALWHGVAQCFQVTPAVIPLLVVPQARVVAVVSEVSGKQHRRLSVDPQVQLHLRDWNDLTRTCTNRQSLTVAAQTTVVSHW